MSRVTITDFFSQPLTHSEIAQKKAREEKRHRQAVKERRSAKEKEVGRKRKVGRPKKEQTISLEEDSGSGSSNGEKEEAAPDDAAKLKTVQI